MRLVPNLNRLIYHVLISIGSKVNLLNRWIFLDYQEKIFQVIQNTWNSISILSFKTTNPWISNMVCSTCTLGSQSGRTHLQWSKSQTLGPRGDPWNAQEASGPTNPRVSNVRSWKKLTHFDVNHNWHASILQNRKCIWKSKSEYMIKGILFESSMETTASTQWAESGSP